MTLFQLSFLLHDANLPVLATAVTMYAQGHFHGVVLMIQRMGYNLNINVLLYGSCFLISDYVILLK